MPKRKDTCTCPQDQCRKRCTFVGSNGTMAVGSLIAPVDIWICKAKHVTCVVGRPIYSFSEDGVEVAR